MLRYNVRKYIILNQIFSMKGIVILMYNILIVEDDILIAELIEMNLTVAGFLVKAVSDGKSVLQSIENNEFDLCLLDVMLPEMDGFELYPHIAKREIPVIYISAKSDTLSKVKGLKLGAEDYITKPFDILELIVRVEKVLERTTKIPDKISVNDITINPSGGEVMQNGLKIELKPMEFKLLLMLAKYPNIIFSRDRLLSAVWGEEFFGETRTVDNHIAILRKKLGWSKYIVTVHRMGYKLVLEEKV